MIYIPNIQEGNMAERAKGIDLSAWNQVTDWQSVKTAGLDFALNKYLIYYKTKTYINKVIIYLN